MNDEILPLYKLGWRPRRRKSPDHGARADLEIPKKRGEVHQGRARSLSWQDYSCPMSSRHTFGCSLTYVASKSIHSREWRSMTSTPLSRSQSIPP